MSISSVAAAGLNGIRTGMGIADRAGGRIARMGMENDMDRLPASVVDLRVGELQVKIAADVVKVADQVLGTLVDIRA